MNKAEIDPWSLPRPAAREETVELPRLNASVMLRALDPLTVSAAMDDARRLTVEFVQGKDGEPASLFPGPDGQPYQLNEVIVTNICMLRAMQPRSEQRPFNWWLGLALHCEEDFQAVVMASQRLNADEPEAQEGEPGNPSAAPSTTG
jgi:hypothetical protein